MLGMFRETGVQTEEGVAVTARTYRILASCMVLTLTTPAWSGISFADGSIAAWGECSWLQCWVPSPNRDFAVVAAGNIHSLGIRWTGVIEAWGDHQLGQCTVPAPNDDFVGVAAGGGHSVGLKADGTVVAWGLNDRGQCTPPPDNSGFVAIGAGVRYTVALKADGRVVVWGDNRFGQCEVPEPNSGFVSVAAGNEFVLGLRRDGSVAAWGLNDYGQCDVPEPNVGFAAVAAGSSQSLGLRSDGAIVPWGDNRFGLGNIPSPNAGFVAVAAGWCVWNLGLRSDGSIAAWGNNSYGQCNVPTPNAGFASISAGGAHSLALRSTSVGACCHENGLCTVTLADLCIAPAQWLGTGTLCAPGACVASSVEDVRSASIIRVFPNPSRGPVTVRLPAANARQAHVEVFDSSGRLVRRLAGASQSGERWSVEWDAKDSRGGALPNGVYQLRLLYGNNSKVTKSVVLLR